MAAGRKTRPTGPLDRCHLAPRDLPKPVEIGLQTKLTMGPIVHFEVMSTA